MRDPARGTTAPLRPPVKQAERPPRAAGGGACDDRGVPAAHSEHPGERVRSLVARDGAPAVVARCVAFLRDGEIDPDFIIALVGPHGRLVLAGREGGPTGYWPRTWALRALLYVWDDSAAEAVVAALDDPHWRVREMALKVIARHRVRAARDAVEFARGDPTPRVRMAAARAAAHLQERS